MHIFFYCFHFINSNFIEELKKIRLEKPPTLLSPEFKLKALTKIVQDSYAVYPCHRDFYVYFLC